MDKERLIQELYDQGLIDIWEAELLSSPSYVIGEIPMPKYTISGSGNYLIKGYILN